MSITAKQLAEKLNISATAVSMALHNKPGVSTETRNLILNAAERYGYDFSKISIKKCKEGCIYVIMYHSKNVSIFLYPSYEKILLGFENVCKKAGYNIKIEHFYERTQDIERFVEELRGSECIGYIILGTDIRIDIAEKLLSMPFPNSLIDAFSEQLNCNSVLINNKQGAFLATDYLISRCGKQPGYLQSAYPLLNFKERREGFMNAVKANGMSFQRCITHQLTCSIEGAMSDMLEIIDSGEQLAECYFADNDSIAIGAIKALKLRNINVPNDISIIGFDNSPESEIIDPSLTTIDIPWKYMGELAGLQIISLIENPVNHISKIEVSTKLVKRFSA